MKSQETLTIVIPALNEERAIKNTIERTIAAKKSLLAAGLVKDVEIIVVNDGSIDKTEEIARNCSEINVLGFDKNHGYGAAIKVGFDFGRGEIVGFLDADGTCAPQFFLEMIRALNTDEADIVLGSRLGPESRMPALRLIGNFIFAWLLGLLSKKHVKDTASGMRLIRRSALPHLYPLPDGLDFTPAMSARALLEGRLKLIEIPMAYSERVGESKLSVVRDGLRFFGSILRTCLCHRPARPLLLLSGLMFGGGLIVGIYPLGHYLIYSRLEEWMIYRTLIASLLTTISLTLACAAVVGEHIAAAAYVRAVAGTGVSGVVVRFFISRLRPVVSGGFVFLALVVTWPGVVQFLYEGMVDMHWSRAVLASLLLVIPVMLEVTAQLLYIARLIERQRTNMPALPTPDRAQRAKDAET